LLTICIILSFTVLNRKRLRRLASGYLQMLQKSCQGVIGVDGWQTRKGRRAVGPGVASPGRAYRDSCRVAVRETVGPRFTPQGRETVPALGYDSRRTLTRIAANTPRDATAAGSPLAGRRQVDYEEPWSSSYLATGAYRAVHQGEDQVPHQKSFHLMPKNGRNRGC
jgi:hypothetical protein